MEDGNLHTGVILRIAERTVKQQPKMKKGKFEVQRFGRHAEMLEKEKKVILTPSAETIGARIN